MSTSEPRSPTDFIRTIVAEDLASGKHGGRVVTRFPPEPNGCLHVGHAKAFCLDFGIAAENGGRCHLRFDDTNPAAEDERFVEAMMKDIRWLGWDWGEHLYHASDYFEQLHGHAVALTKAGKAYVCDLSEEEIREYRGTVKEAGKESPFRERPVAESLDLLERMRRGEFEDGARVLRARIDMASPNMKMRDPLIYRIRRVPHHRTGDAWNIYPMYDFAHCLSDSMEGITHSLCSLEFENNRELYDWFLDELAVPCHPQQIEFARLNLTHTVLSKRRLAALVDEGRVDGWDDPRLPTLAGLRRRGYTPEAIRAFLDRVGVARRESTVDMAQLEHALREDLNARALRVMAVLRPIRLVIENYPEDRVEELEAINNPEDDAAGTRSIPFSRVLYIEREDFMEDPPRKFFRLAPDREVRLKHAYLVTCTGFEKDESGEIVEVRCTYDPETRGGVAPAGRRPKATLHWVSAAHAHDAEVRLYDKLFNTENPGEGKDFSRFTEDLNPESLVTLRGCKVEPGLAEAEPDTSLQFLRQGYFCRDSGAGLVFNRAVSLRDTWAKVQRRKQA